MRYLNLGCGNRFHKEWTNVDFVSNGDNVIAYNLLKGIPFDDSYFDMVYHSHILEHFSKHDGFVFMKECFRVLKKGGIIRIVVPDLELLVKEYIKALENAEKSDTLQNKANYEWAVIELIDQMVREKPGGEMLKYWEQKEIINEEQVIKRVGHEFLRIRQAILKKGLNDNNVKIKIPSSSLKERIKSFLFKKLHIVSENLELGNFRNGGEVHKWMYDRYSLKKLMTEIGFKEIKVQSANESYISDWEKYSSLDVENNLVRKPDSLFIEAKK